MLYIYVLLVSRLKSDNVWSRNALCVPFMSSHCHLIYSYGSPSCMVYIYFCNVLIIMITTRLDPGWGLCQTFFILCLYYLLVVCSYGLYFYFYFLVVYVFYDIVVSLICLYAICGMLYYVSKVLFIYLYIYISVLLCLTGYCMYIYCQLLAVS